MSGTVLFLLAGGLICLIGLTGLGIWILSEQKRQKAWVERRDSAIGSYLKPKAVETPVLITNTRQRQQPDDMLARVHRVFNWREDRRSQYPMSWGGVAMIMLGPSVVLGLLASKVVGPIGWLTVPFLDVFMVRSFLGYCVAKVSRELLSQFPDALSMISRSVRVGVPLGEAIKVVAREGLSPTREEFGKAADAVGIGLDMETALIEMAERNDLTEYRFFATALSLQSQTGGGLTETLDTLADTIRKREAARKRGSALASEAKTSIYVLTALPAVTGVMLYLSSPDYIGILFTTTSGEKLLGIAVFMLGLGLFSMQQIIKRSLS